MIDAGISAQLEKTGNSRQFQSEQVWDRGRKCKYLEE